MLTSYCPLRSHFANSILGFVEGLNLQEVFESIVDPPQPEMGDLSFPCFLLAKKLKKSPALVAQELSVSLQGATGFEKVESTGPYLNVVFSLSFLGEKLLLRIQSGEFFKTNLFKESPYTMVEYSQPNTHKELHVGHMRNAALGDAVVRILRYAGTQIVTSTFPGDMGAHVAKCLWYFKYHNTEPVPMTQKGEWLGKLYSRAHIKLEDEVNSPQGAENKKQLTEILKQLENQTGEFHQLWLETRQWSIDLMKQVYAWAHMEFDQWYWESEVDSSSVRFVEDLFAKGLLIESQGAIGMDLEADKLGFCMLLKSDRTGLYATKDLELARRKFQDYKIEKNIYVVDLRQALHFKQVFKVLERLGFKEAKQCYHLQYNFVELPDGPMSSRKGNIVPLLQLVHRMEDLVKQKYLVRYRNEWSEDEINLVASQVAQGAIKYGMVKIDQNKKIVFDMEEWLKIEGDSGPFIQYSVARIHSLCSKLEYQFQTEALPNWTLLTHSSERLLIKSLMNFHAVVAAAAVGYKPSILCTYLFETAKRFNLFYHECSVGRAETVELGKARLALSYCTGAVLEQGLSLIGIPSPQRM